MTKQEINDLKNKPLAELQKARTDGRERLRGLKLDLAAGKVKNEAELRALRKDLARIETFITLRQAQGKPDNRPMNNANT